MPDTTPLKSGVGLGWGGWFDVYHSTQVCIPLKPLFSRHKGTGVQFTDEPTGNLDSRTSQDVLGLLKVTSARFSQTVIMITHNEEIAQLADRILRIEDGKIVRK